MRPLLPCDLDSAVGVLLAAPRSGWPKLAQQLLFEANIADRFRRGTGRAHPVFGAGSLAAVAGTHPSAPLPAWCDATYCDALAVVLAEVLASDSSSAA